MISLYILCRWHAFEEGELESDRGGTRLATRVKPPLQARASRTEVLVHGNFIISWGSRFVCVILAPLHVTCSPTRVFTLLMGSIWALHILGQPVMFCVWLLASRFTLSSQWSPHLCISFWESPAREGGWQVVTVMIPKQVHGSRLAHQQLRSAHQELHVLLALLIWKMWTDLSWGDSMKKLLTC